MSSTYANICNLLFCGLHKWQQFYRLLEGDNRDMKCYKYMRPLYKYTYNRFLIHYFQPQVHCEHFCFPLKHHGCDALLQGRLPVGMQTTEKTQSTNDLQPDFFQFISGFHISGAPDHQQRMRNTDLLPHLEGCCQCKV